MSHLWIATIIIDQTAAKDLIEQQCSLIVHAIELLGEGFDNIAYLVNKELVFRFPRRQMGIDCMENEIALLPYIAKQVSFPFSCPLYIAKPTHSYPSSFAGYPIVPGTPLCDIPVALISDSHFAKTLAIWLKELHSVPVLKEHVQYLKGDQSWRYDIDGMITKRKSMLEQYESYFVDAGFNTKDLFTVLEQLALLDYIPLEQNTYVHGDLYSRHLLVDDKQQLTGIIDWGDIHIGSAAYDLTVVYSLLAPNAQDLFFQYYGAVTDPIKNFALMRAFCHAIALLAYCYETHQENLKQWTILTFRNVIKKIKLTNV